MSEKSQQAFESECRRIRQNAEYTAQVHHDMAKFYQGLAFWLQLLPALVSAVTATLVAAGQRPPSLLWLTIVAASVSAVVSILNPNKEYQGHLRAAKAFTVLRHDARFLCEAQVHAMNLDQFCAQVERLHDRYNDAVESAPTTARWFFERARTFIQKGRHEPDLNDDGSIK